MASSQLQRTQNPSPGTHLSLRIKQALVADHGGQRRRRVVVEFGFGAKERRAKCGLWMRR
jgi:hypothetical protein